MSDWTTADGGKWSDASEWTGGVPDAAGATASFTVAFGGTQTMIITFAQGEDFTVGTLNIVTDSNDGWAFRGAAGVTDATLRFQGLGGGPAFINVDTNGSNRLSEIQNNLGLKVALDSDLIVTTADSDTLFEISAPITGSRDIYKFGAGTLRLSGSNAAMTGDFFLNGGRTEITGANAVSGVGVIRLNNSATLAAVSNDFTLAENIETGSGDADGSIAAQTGRTLTLTGQIELRGNDSSVVSFGSATDTGTIVLSGTSLINGAGSFNIAGGTVRFGDAGVAANYFAAMAPFGQLAQGGVVKVQAGAILDTGGFAAVIDNLDLDGGTLRSTGGALDVTVDQTNTGSGNAGTITGTAQADRIVFNVASGLDLSGVTFGNWTSGPDTITINGSDNANIITGSSSSDTINGGGGDDFINGHESADTIRGGTGNDIYAIITTQSTLIENPGEGTDTISTSVLTDFTLPTNFENLSFAGFGQHTGIGNAADNVLTGGQGTDELQGLGGNDTLLGDQGNDILDGGTGADRTEGGLGDDFFFLDNAGDTVIELAGQGSDRIFAGLSYTLAAGVSVEMMTTTNHAGTAAINLTGNELANTIFGNAGANVLDGKAGADTLVGQAGDDFYHVDNAADRVTETAGQGSDRVFASASYTLGTGASVELMTTNANAGTTAINLTGNELANTIYGNAGANTLDGRGGVDALVGLAGDDFYHVDNGADRAIEAAGEGSDRVFASVSFTLGAGSSVELMTTNSHAGTTAIDLTGNELANTIFGNAGINQLDGKGGGDVLVGQAGADSFAFTTAPGAGNVDRIADFVSGDDTIALDNAVFTQVGGLGALNANAFVTGTAAADADDRIVYNQATGQLFYDADGNGAGAALLFATLDGNPALAASDFQVI